MNPYDVLLSGGRVIDPASGRDAICDVAISGGRITEIAPAIDHTKAVRWIDAAGRLVVPGLIDIHAHVNHRGARNGLDPDLAGVASGVTTVVDAGHGTPERDAESRGDGRPDEQGSAQARSLGIGDQVDRREVSARWVPMYFPTAPRDGRRVRWRLRARRISSTS